MLFRRQIVLSSFNGKSRGHVSFLPRKETVETGEEVLMSVSELET